MELREVSFNQTVQLASDANFRGYVYGQSDPPDLVLGPVMLVFVKAPGATGKHGVTLLPLSELRPVARLMR